MSYNAIQKSKDNLSKGVNTKEAADQLLDASQDPISAWLDIRVKYIKKKRKHQLSQRIFSKKKKKIERIRNE